MLIQGSFHTGGWYVEGVIMYSQVKLQVRRGGSMNTILSAIDESVLGKVSDCTFQIFDCLGMINAGT